MSDVHLATPPTEPLANDPTLRTPDGTIKDVATTETKAPETITTEPPKKDEPKVEDKPEGPPEKYEFNAPEGVTLDPAVIEAATPIFKELGLTNEQAQKLVDLQAKREATSATAAYDAYVKTRNGWRDEIIGDRSIGNGNDNLLPEVQANIATAIDSIGDPALSASFREAMNLTGAGDHPSFVRLMNKIGKALGEGTVVRGNPAAVTAPNGRAKSNAQVIFPHLPSANS